MTINAYPVETLQSLKKQRHSHSLPPNTVCGVPFDKFNDFSIKNKVQYYNMITIALQYFGVLLYMHLKCYLFHFIADHVMVIVRCPQSVKCLLGS